MKTKVKGGPRFYVRRSEQGIARVASGERKKGIENEVKQKGARTRAGDLIEPRRDRKLAYGGKANREKDQHAHREGKR